MQKALIIAALLGSFIATVDAEEFYLKHENTGKVYGPFQTDTGAAVTIGSATFTVVKKNTERSAIEMTLNNIKLPQIDLRGAALRDCIKFLEIQTREYAPKGAVVNFVVVEPQPQPKAQIQSSQGFFDESFARPETNLRNEVPRVELELIDVSVLAVLKLMMEQTGATYRISGNTVTVYPKN